MTKKGIDKRTGCNTYRGWWFVSFY